MCISDKYLQRNATKLNGVSEITPGNLLVVGYGSEGYRACVVPSRRSFKIGEESVSFDAIAYEVHSVKNGITGGELPEENISGTVKNHHFVLDWMAFLALGVYTPNPGSALEGRLGKKLGHRLQLKAANAKASPKMDDLGALVSA